MACSKLKSNRAIKLSPRSLFIPPSSHNITAQFLILTTTLTCLDKSLELLCRKSVKAAWNRSKCRNCHHCFLSSFLISYHTTELITKCNPFVKPIISCSQEIWWVFFFKLWYLFWEVNQRRSSDSQGFKCKVLLTYLFWCLRHMGAVGVIIQKDTIWHTLSN